MPRYKGYVPPKGETLWGHLAPEIGMFVIFFSKFEWHLDGSIPSALDIEIDTGHKLLAEVHSLPAKLRMLESACQARPDFKQIKEQVSHIVTLATELNTFRNWLVHSGFAKFGKDPTTNDATFVKEKYRRGGNAEKKTRELTVAEVVENIQKCLELNEKIGRLSVEIINRNKGLPPHHPITLG